MGGNAGRGKRVSPCQEQPSVLHSPLVWLLPSPDCGTLKAKTLPAQGLAHSKCSRRGGMNELSSSNTSVFLKKPLSSHLALLIAPKITSLSCFPTALFFCTMAGQTRTKVLPDDSGKLFPRPCCSSHLAKPWLWAGEGTCECCVARGSPSPGPAAPSVMNDNACLTAENSLVKSFWKVESALWMWGSGICRNVLKEIHGCEVIKDDPDPGQSDGGGQCFTGAYW